jgi:hypothetical protein
MRRARGELAAAGEHGLGELLGRELAALIGVDVRRHPKARKGLRDNLPGMAVGRDRGAAKIAGHPFYTRLNALLDANDFDRFVEGQCARFYAPMMGRPSLVQLKHG